MTHRPRRLQRRDHTGAMATIEASLRTVQSANLAIAGLGFAGLIALIRVAYVAGIDDGLSTGAIVMAISAAAAFALAALIWTRRAAHPRRYGIAGVVGIDALAIVLRAVDEVGSALGVGTTLLLIACVTTASGFPRRFCTAHAIVAAALATIFAAGIPDGRPVLDHVFDASVAIGVLITTTLLVCRVATTITRHIGQLRTLALTDGLTGALNRRGLADAFSRLSAELRPGDPLGVVMVDIDHFKWFNDQYGHDMGDTVLQRVGAALRDTAGRDDLVSRIGGEELAVIVRGPAAPVAESFQRALATARSPRVTASIGIVDTVAGHHHDPDHLWRLLGAADKALYEAKNRGRDRICVGEFDEYAPVSARPVQVPERTAVDATDENAVAPSPHLPGWTLLLLSTLSLVWCTWTDATPMHASLSPVFTALIFSVVIIGAVLVGTTPLLERFRWAAGVIGSDLVIGMMLFELDSSAGRIAVLLPLTLTGLMVAQRFSRFSLTLHNLMVCLACLVALAPDMTVPTMTAVATRGLVVVGAAEFVFWLRERNDRAATDLHRWSVTDPLTGLVNRHGLEIAFPRLSTAEQLAVLAVDVNDFKSINDTYGHAVGDEVLIKLADTLRTVAGAGAVVGRIGGDEFVVVAPSAQPVKLAQTVDRAVGLLPIPLSVSIGTAVAAQYRLRALWSLVKMADTSLIRAKHEHHAGRDAARPSDGRTTPSAPSPATVRVPAGETPEWVCAARSGPTQA